MDKETAEQVLEMAMAASQRADESVELAMKLCSSEELVVYRRRAGAIMASIFENIMVPVYQEHPTLAPQWYRDMDADAGSRSGKV